MAHRFARAAAGLSLVLGQTISVLPADWTAGATASELRNTATVKLVQQARPAIVNIHGQKTLSPSDEGYRRGETQNVNGMGTGIIIDERGYILTNYHVVDGVKEIHVTLADKSPSDKRPYVATRVSHDNKTDLAIIKINAQRKLPVITIGTSCDLMIGEPVVAVGNAYGYEHTVTRGIVSALHRTVQISDTQNYRDLIQTDASINPGNSGGPLLNIDGEMIGINVAVRQGAQGIGFAIPVDMAMGIAGDLLSAERERLENTWHGIVTKQSNSTATLQCVVGQVEDDSPAAKSGLQPGDVITSVGDSSIARTLDIERALLGHQPGDDVSLTVSRNKQPVNVKLTLTSITKRSPNTERDRDRERERVWDTIGLRLEPVTPQQLKGHQKHYRGGLLVTAVRPDSPASRDGIKRGDVLLGMHVWETISLENVSYIIKLPEFETLQPVKFLILRNEATYYGHLSVTTRR